jgi:2-polyprenyl-6-hydroxyphenyl methylase/3-demethylubiquinone-9 3-methyltransferase
MTEGVQAFDHEVESGQRFEFGANWARFLGGLTEEQIAIAERSLSVVLERETLRGSTFLDIGCGSGLFSLAARRLGATVRSFDYDPKSAACAAELHRRYYPSDPTWAVERGSILDQTYLSSLGQFDVVYSWGVLHHTGHMWEAVANATSLVAPGGKLCLAIYNDQGGWSEAWKRIKRIYNSAPRPLRTLILGICAVRLRGPTLVRNIFSGRPPRAWLGDTERGMRIWTDIVDWIGGYPFEYAKPEDVFAFIRDRGFTLRQLKTCAGGHGCCEYVFYRNAH